ncbi:MAG: ribbon-helix-helix protein, CopG family [Candidatus Riflebacteria bacterium]|nr:ribbon-helix-helix protein, CopG family [Candidatus Riflebacteria bacterium]
MAKRTSIVLDEETRRAARELANRLDCSTSEAIRRAILRFRDLTSGVPLRVRKERGRTLERLAELFEGHDAAEEIARLKKEDEGF